MAKGSRRGGASGARRSSAARSSTKSTSTRQKRGRQGVNNDVMDEVILLLVLTVSVLLFLSDLKLIGSFGKTVSGVLFGVFGIAAYVLPFALFFSAAFLISNKRMPGVGARIGAYILLVLIICSFAHLIGMKDYADTPLKDFYGLCSEGRKGGGVAGAAVSSALIKAIGRIGAYIVLIVLTIICGVIITERSFVRGVRKGSRTLVDKSREGAKRHHEHRAVRQEELRSERELREQERAVRQEELRVDRERRAKERAARQEEQRQERELREMERAIEREERREARREAVAEREEALKERKLRRSEMKVSGVMLNTKLTDETALAQTEAEDRKEALEELESSIVAETAEAVFISEDIHELKAEDLQNIEDIRAFRRSGTEQTEKIPMAELDAVNFKSVHHISLEHVVDGGQNMAYQAPEKSGNEYNASNREEKIVSINRQKPVINEPEAACPQPVIKIASVAFPDIKIPEELKEQAGAGIENTEADEIDYAALLKEMSPGGTKTEPAPDPEMMTEPEAKTEPQAEPETEPEPEMKSEPEVVTEYETRTEPESEPAVKAPYMRPDPALLEKPKNNQNGDSMEELRRTAGRLQETLATFGVHVTMTEISQGPTVTRFEMQPDVGVKVSKILSLSDDIKLNMAATDVRIEAPIPGKAAVGIEIPNKTSIPVNFRELVEDPAFQNASSHVSFAVGKDIEGRVVVTDIAKMPHLLIAGATGSGKSVCINTLIMSILFKADPEDVKLIMIDPKVVELSVYNGIPHLMIPVVTDPKKAAAALQWGVVEMDDRYNKFAEYKVRDMKGYNKLVESDQFSDVPEEERPRKMPQIVIIVDELADLMMVASKEVEEAICRIAQKARAAGIHLVIATQRPSVDVITGLIKANMPSRIAFSVSSGTDSRTILDMVGAEKLLGKGDMLFYPQGYSKPARLQGAFISDDEVTAVVDYLKEQSEGADYDHEVINRMNAVSDNASSAGAGLTLSGDNNGKDEFFEKAARFIIEKDKASIGMLQRSFKIGFNRAARIMDQLAEAGVVGEEEGTKPRRILMSEEQFDQYVEEYL
ncbi:MAG: DNA translocase FtsK [Lachnospiraceae bacterium]|nr:DNA translocase FtsK [Lachnospiraceae bacterium]